MLRFRRGNRLLVCFPLLIILYTLHLFVNRIDEMNVNSRHEFESPLVVEDGSELASLKFVLHSDKLIQLQSADIKLDKWEHVTREEITLWPNEKRIKKTAHSNDRIVNQMRFIPESSTNNTHPTIKKLFLNNGDFPPADKSCPEQRCQNTIIQQEADLILQSGGTDRNSVLWLDQEREKRKQEGRPGPAFVRWELESVRHSASSLMGVSEFTATYRWDSDLVLPYYKYQPFDPADDDRHEPYDLPTKNYAEGKFNKAAMLVSNCNPATYRIPFAKTLDKFFPVDIYGGCGSMKCSGDCLQDLSKYKFYLAFENSFCKDYITEKFFLRGLKNNVIPVVLGARRSDYERAAPPHSFIHVDDFDSIESLGKHMHDLSKNDRAYNLYFSWHGHGMVDLNCFSWCRLCMLAHEVPRIRESRGQVNYYDSHQDWWSRDQCVDSGWTVGRPREFHNSQTGQFALPPI